MAFAFLAEILYCLQMEEQHRFGDFVILWEDANWTQTKH